MRVSSNTLFESNVANLNQQQARQLATQQQIATGRRIQNASDDPVAAARIIDVSQADAMNTQYAANLGAARDALSISENTLGSITSLLQDVRTTMVQAGNGTLNNGDRQTLAAGLSGTLQELIGLANSTDASGNYLFAGYQFRTQPFADIAGAGVVYSGDDGQRNIQINAGRQIPASVSGADLFMRIKNGNGTFTTQSDPASHAGSGNTGSGVVSAGTVVNPALLTGNNYRIDFTVAAGVTTYTVTNTTNGNPTVPPLAGIPYVSGQAISFDGMQFDIKGTPANGDAFTVTPSANESVFKTISDFINVLNTPVTSGSAADMAKLNNGLNSGLNNLDQALNSITNSRSSLGVRLNEVDAVKAVGDGLGLQLTQALSDLQDTDYNKAISDLTQQQMYLKAAQQSFANVAGLSLFNYIR